VIVLVVIPLAIIYFQTTVSTSTTSATSLGSTTLSLSMTEKTDILNRMAQEPAANVVQDYCEKNPWEKICETEISSHVSEMRHNHTDPVPESPITLTSPEPCNMLCVVWDSETDVEVKNTGPDPITVLVVTVSKHDVSAEPIPLSPLQVIGPGQTVPVPLQYANGTPVGIILYYN
jgi:hypothetical protein